MAYDHGLAHRIRERLDDNPGVTDKEMFGGIAFFLDGNMACGVTGDKLMVRVGPERYETALAQPNVNPFDMTGRPMRGWVTIDPVGYESDASLYEWVDQGITFAQTLPPK